MNDVRGKSDKYEDVVMFWTAVALTIGLTMRSMFDIILSSDVCTIDKGVVSKLHKGDSLSTWDKSAYIHLDNTFIAEIAMPSALSGVFFIANFSLVYIAVTASAFLLGLANYAVSETSVVLSGVDNVKINDAICRWANKSIDKPDIHVMSGFLKQWCLGSKGPVLSYAQAAVSLYQDSFVFLFRVAIAHTLLFVSIGLILIVISRMMNVKWNPFIKKSKRSPVQSLFVRHINGKTYIRRSVLVYIGMVLPQLSVLLVVLLQRFHVR